MIDDVIRNMREEYLNESVDAELLEELKQVGVVWVWLWRSISMRVWALRSSNRWVWLCNMRDLNESVGTKLLESSNKWVWLYNMREEYLNEIVDTRSGCGYVPLYHIIVKLERMTEGLIL